MQQSVCLTGTTSHRLANCLRAIGIITNSNPLGRRQRAARWHILRIGGVASGRGPTLGCPGPQGPHALPISPRAQRFQWGPQGAERSIRRCPGHGAVGLGWLRGPILLDAASAAVVAALQLLAKGKQPWRRGRGGLGVTRHAAAGCPVPPTYGEGSVGGEGGGISGDGPAPHRRVTAPGPPSPRAGPPVSGYSVSRLPGRLKGKAHRVPATHRIGVSTDWRCCVIGGDHEK